MGVGYYFKEEFWVILTRSRNFGKKLREKTREYHGKYGELLEEPLESRNFAARTQKFEARSFWLG